MKNFKNIFGILHNIVSAIFIALIIAVILRVFFLSVFYIPSSSMEDTLKRGDYILVWKFLYNNRIPVFNIKLPFGIKIKRGDVIVFIAPENSNEDYIKRCIGLPGDKIEFKENNIYINGKIVNEPYIKDKNIIFYAQKSYIVPDNHIFVMGDNRLNSSDSREWGCVPEKNIIGKALFIFFPFNRIKVIK